MLSSPKRSRSLIALAVAILALAMIPARDAIAWRDHVVGGILVDPDGQVSSFGLPTWDGFVQGLHYPDQIIAVNDTPLTADSGYRAATWDRAIDAAAAAGSRTVRVVARTGADQPRHL